MEQNKEIPTVYQFCQSHSLVDSYGKADEFIEAEFIKLIKLHLSKQAEVIAEEAELEGDEGSNFDYIRVNKQFILQASEEYIKNIK